VEVFKEHVMRKPLQTCLLFAVLSLIALALCIAIIVIQMLEVRPRGIADFRSYPTTDALEDYILDNVSIHVTGTDDVVAFLTSNGISNGMDDSNDNCFWWSDPRKGSNEVDYSCRVLAPDDIPSNVDVTVSLFHQVWHAYEYELNFSFVNDVLSNVRVRKVMSPSL
jgi:hypothetical protein